jgi:hypothetical protein
MFARPSRRSARRAIADLAGECRAERTVSSRTEDLEIVTGGVDARGDADALGEDEVCAEPAGCTEESGADEAQPGATSSVAAPARQASSRRR